MKYLTKKDFLFPTDELHSNYRILKVKDAFEMQLLNFVHICLNKNVIPLFHNYYTLQQSSHTYETRIESHVVVPRSRINFGLSTVKSTGAKIWNNYTVAHNYLDKSKWTLKKHVFNSIIDRYN